MDLTNRQCLDIDYMIIRETLKHLFQGLYAHSEKRNKILCDIADIPMVGSRYGWEAGE